MFPDEEFLPRAPDPEEIIIGEENEVAPAHPVYLKEEFNLPYFLFFSYKQRFQIHECKVCTQYTKKLTVR